MRILAALLLFASLVLAQDEAEAYRKEVAALDKSRPESVCAARDSLRLVMVNSNAGVRAGSFRIFRKFYLREISATLPAFTKAMKPFAQDTEDWFMKSAGPDSTQAILRRRPDIRKAGAGWFDCGFSIQEGEGDLYPAEDPATLLEFTGKLPKDLSGYIRFLSLEDTKKLVDDAALQLTWEQLRLRIERWERFGPVACSTARGSIRTTTCR